MIMDYRFTGHEISGQRCLISTAHPAESRLEFRRHLFAGVGGVGSSSSSWTNHHLKANCLWKVKMKLNYIISLSIVHSISFNFQVLCLGHLKEASTNIAHVSRMFSPQKKTSRMLRLHCRDANSQGFPWSQMGGKRWQICLNILHPGMFGKYFW